MCEFLKGHKGKGFVIPGKLDDLQHLRASSEPSGSAGLEALAQPPAVSWDVLHPVQNIRGSARRGACVLWHCHSACATLVSVYLSLVHPPPKLSEPWALRRRAAVPLPPGRASAWWAEVGVPGTIPRIGRFRPAPNSSSPVLCKKETNILQPESQNLAVMGI